MGSGGPIDIPLGAWIPLLEQEGWLRHQENAAKQPELVQSGWSGPENLD